ncbi:hypothetical protein EDB84DRAFT_1483395, partial [Lactarius hengduanensis]
TAAVPVDVLTAAICTAVPAIAPVTVPRHGYCFHCPRHSRLRRHRDRFVIIIVLIAITVGTGHVVTAVVVACSVGSPQEKGMGGVLWPPLS